MTRSQAAQSVWNAAAVGAPYGAGVDERSGKVKGGRSRMCSVSGAVGEGRAMMLRREAEV